MGRRSKSGNQQHLAAVNLNHNEKVNLSQSRFLYTLVTVSTTLLVTGLFYLLYLRTPTLPPTTLTTTGEEPLKFFISYRQNCSRALAGLVYFGLREFGQKVFIDKESLGGGRVSTAINKSITEYDVFVFIVDTCTFPQGQEVTVDQDWVAQEVLLAHKLNKKIVICFHNNLVKFPAQLDFLNGLLGIKHSKFGPSNFIREILKHGRQYHRDGGFNVENVFEEWEPGSGVPGSHQPSGKTTPGLQDNSPCRNLI